MNEETYHAAMAVLDQLHDKINEAADIVERAKASKDEAQS